MPVGILVKIVWAGNSNLFLSYKNTPLKYAWKNLGPEFLSISLVQINGVDSHTHEEAVQSFIDYFDSWIK